MTPRELALQKIALRCRSDLYFLAREILNYDKMTPGAHQELCDYTTSILPGHEAPQTEGFDPRKNLLLLLMPRGTFKSSVVTIGFTLQFFLNEPDGRVLIDSETFSKAKAFFREIKWHLEQNEAYREVFRAIHGVFPLSTKNKMELWTDSELILACRKSPKKEPSISCAGVDVTKNGMHYDLIIADDLHSEKNVTNIEQIQQVIDHYKLAFSLLDPGKPLIIIGTRWHYSDLYQHIMDFEREDFNILKKSAYNEDGSLLFPEVLNEKELDKIRKRQGASIFCNPGEAPILMADWSTKRLDEIKVGDEIIGFENGEGQRNKGSTRNKLLKTTVLDITKRIADTQIVNMESGRQIRCTPDHHWYTGRKDATHRPYAPVVVGRKMMQIVNTDDNLYLDPDKIIDWAWLGGMIDGEGACKYGSISIHQYPSSNPEVFARIDSTLKRLKLPYKKYERSFVINGGRQSKFDVLRYAKPAKSYQILDTLWKKNTGMVSTKDKVVSILPYGKEEVYGLTTGTGNYVAWGYASKNSKQYLNEPVSDENAVFKRDQIIRKNWEEVRGIPINWYLSVDPSYEGQYSDFAALVLAGMDYQRNLYVKWITRKKYNYSEIINEMFRIYTESEVKIQQVLIETVGPQKSIMFELNNEQKRRNTWMPVKQMNPNKNKEERIRGLAPFYEFGHIFHIKECPNLEELEYELLLFPSARHDDMIDALASILEIASPPKGRNIDYDDREKTKHRILPPRSFITGV